MFSHERLKSILEGLTLHLVEASPALSAIQHHTLQELKDKHTPPLGPTSLTGDEVPSSIPYKTCILDNHSGVEASWYQRLEEVPQG